MPFDKKKYPQDWKKISIEIRARSGGRCECIGECGLHQPVLVWRVKSRFPERKGERVEIVKRSRRMNSILVKFPDGFVAVTSGNYVRKKVRRCEERNGEPARWARGKVVLTVAHLNHRPMDCRPENLKALCQRCHLRYDAALHAENARKTRRRKIGQRSFLEPDEPEDPKA